MFKFFIPWENFILKVLYVFELKKLLLVWKSRKEKVSGLHITVVENNLSLVAIAFCKLCTFLKRDKSYYLELMEFEWNIVIGRFIELTYLEVLMAPFFYLASKMVQIHHCKLCHFGKIWTFLQAMVNVWNIFHPLKS